MTWDPADKSYLNKLTQMNIGQVTLNDQLGKLLYSYAADEKIKSILEIGTWNGRGSTRCIVEGLKRRTTPCVFYSLECNADKCNNARELYKDMSNVHILNEVLLTSQPADIETIFPELVENAQFKYWNSVDFDNMAGKPLFLERADLPEVFDLLLLDGGEFTTWYEYLQLKDRCKILALDDTRVAKCRRIVAELKAQPEKWKIILDSPERNGTLVAVRIGADTA
jgi:hypothetical protein